MPETPFYKKRSFQVVAGAVVVLIVLAGGALWWLTKDDAPEAVSLDAAVDVIAGESSTTTDAPATSDDTPTSNGSVAETSSTTAAEEEPAGIDGTWTVDTSIGEFSFEEATSSFAGFRIDETLAGGIDVVAVGRTPTISGTMTIEGTTLTATDITVTLADVKTNDNRRDNAARRAMNTSEHPDAFFSLTEAVELGDAAAAGEPVAVSAVGELTVNGITQPSTFELQAQLVNGIVVVTGNTDVVFADFGIDTPSAPIVASLDDFGILELQLFFTR